MVDGSRTQELLRFAWGLPLNGKVIVRQLGLNAVLLTTNQTTTEAGLFGSKMFGRGRWLEL